MVISLMGGGFAAAQAAPEEPVPEAAPIEQAAVEPAAQA